MMAADSHKGVFSLIILVMVLFVAAPSWCHDGNVVASCDVVGIGGDHAASRGLQFKVAADFASVEVRLNPSIGGVYEFTAELRRSAGFGGPVLAAVRVTAPLTAVPQTPYAVVHIDYPLIGVSGVETFTLRFVDIVGPGILYVETAGIGNFPCPDIIVTEDSVSGAPVPRSSATGLRILAAQDAVCAGSGCDGDINGDLVVDLEDLVILAANWLRTCLPAEAPVLLLNGSAIDEGIAGRMAELFGLPGGIIGEDGAARYTNEELFQFVPTALLGQGESEEDRLPVHIEAFDFGAIRGEVLDGKTARNIVGEALTASGFKLPDALKSTISVDHSMFDAVRSDGEPITSVPLDTHVDFAFMQGNIPVLGPGAKMKFVLNADGKMTHLTMALPAVQGVGQVYPLLSQQKADALARQAYGLPRGIPVQLTSQLVYWIPAGGSKVTQLVPQLLYGGTMTLPDAGGVVELRRILIPAIARENAPELVPQVYLYADTSRDAVFAATEVGGGTPPYTWTWSSSTTDLSGRTDSSIQYAIVPRPDMPAPKEEILTVVVTDAAGLSTSASETMVLAGAALQALPPTKVGGVVDVGTEWVGTSQGLGGSAGNAAGFVLKFILAGVHVRFNWGDFNAWERDFKDPSLGGNDTNWIDNVDAAFYTGHANGKGFTFSSTKDDGFLHYTDARWGNNDLEWLVIAACGPLQLESDGKHWWQRWGPAFQGLHMILAYQNVSNDNTVEGGKYAAYLLGGKTVRQAWIDTAIEVQPSSVRFGVMGVIGKDGMSNWNDRFWNRGPTGPDIKGSNIVGYWLVHGPC
ncbi:MAG: hypothetical protein IH624_19465 [Phycisphaerae bacterium]|nr:hypothetical protein [Phycisphaerae bacterium]